MSDQIPPPPDVYEFSVPAGETLILTKSAPNYSVTFHNGGVQVGAFDFNVTPSTFTGDVDESAKLFVEAVIKMFDAYKATGSIRPDDASLNQDKP